MFEILKYCLARKPPQIVADCVESRILNAPLSNKFLSVALNHCPNYCNENSHSWGHAPIP